MGLITSTGITVVVSMVLPAVLSAATVSGSCEATPQIRQEMKRLNLDELKGLEREKAQQKIIQELLTENPDDVFLQLRYQEVFRPHTEGERTALIDRFRELTQAHAGVPEYEYLYAAALVGKDTPRAMSLAKGAATADPAYPRAHLLLAEIHNWGKFADRPKTQAELDAFFSACPAALDTQALRMAAHSGSKDLQSRLAKTLRERLSKETDPDLLEDWEVVWNFEFKTRPVTEHDQVRKQIAAELTRLHAANPKPDAGWTEFLKHGYHLAGDEAKANAEEGQLLAQFPESDEARRVVTEKWYKAHPWPGADENKQKEYWNLALARANATLQRKPKDEEALIDRFRAYAALENASVEQLTTAGDTMLPIVEANRDMFYAPPLEFQVAQAYLKKKIRAEQVPALVNQGLATESLMQGLPSDNESADWHKSVSESDAYMAREAASILLDAAQQLHEPEIAQSAVAKVEAQSPEKPAGKSSQFQVEAKWAELQGRKLDAFLLYRAALDNRPESEKPKKDDELPQNTDRLWKELGGTDASRALLISKPIKPATDDGRWEKPDKEMKNWELTDLKGQTWKLASLEGRTVLVNVWATWCGPCKAEHPHLQKLYDRLKGDPHFQIITFNIDDEVGNVAPYIKENKYTFPVLLAKDYTDELSVDSIPRNWLVDTKGKWQWQQIGFGSEEKWDDEMLEKLQATK
jgi:thiol-disulfide isomerase/thioredoxin